jgi:GGDEF domain-containing protein
MNEPLTAVAPRPVWNPAIEELAQDADEAVRRWLLALVAGLPLDALERLPLAQLASESRTFCAVTIRALGSDVELGRLSPGGELHALAGRLVREAGVGGAAGALSAAEALRGALWDLLAESLPAMDGRFAGDLAGRLAHVCAQIAAAGIERGRPSEQERLGGVSGESVIAAEPVPLSEPQLEGSLAAHDTREEETAAAAFDEREDVEYAAPGTVANGERASKAAPERGTAAWMGAIARRLERYREDERPFAVLLVEVQDSSRLAQADEDGEVGRALEALERALGGLLRPGDALTRQSLGRYWLIAPDTDEGTAAALAERIATAVEESAEHRGAPLQAAVGVAVCPRDGRTAAELAACADMGVFTARASGHSGAPPR